MSDKLREQHSIRNYFKEKIEGTAKTGSTEPQDLQVAAYMDFHYRLSHQEETICKLLAAISLAQEEQESAQADLASHDKLSTDIAVIQKEMELETKAIRHEESKDIFAGALFVVLNSLVRSMAARVHSLGGKEHQTAAGRQIGSTNLFELLRAAGNNFRHHEEWTDPTAKNKNFPVLKAAGLSEAWDRNHCYDVFMLVGWTDADSLISEIKKLGSEIFQYQTGIPL